MFFMNQNNVKIVIGIVSYNDKHYLEKTLPLFKNLKESKIVILDNAHNDEIRKFLEQEYPQIIFLRHPKGNIGFGKGYNYILEKSPNSEYLFCVNGDILIETKAFDTCISYLDQNKNTCMCSGKLHYWDFEKNEKTDVIDTLGIVGTKAHHFWDRGQGKKDKGQYDNSINKIIGISGAAFIIRRSCIKQLFGDSNKLFDENIFIYKEDIDLAYRMRWLDMKITFLNEVLGYHDRTLPMGKKKSPFLAKESYKNHLIMLKNNFSSHFSLNTKLFTFMLEFLKFFYYLFTKPKVAMQLFQVLKMKKIYKSNRKISPKKMESYLLK